MRCRRARRAAWRSSKESSPAAFVTFIQVFDRVRAQACAAQYGSGRAGASPGAA
jgi:hypothetical protein